MIELNGNEVTPDSFCFPVERVNALETHISRVFLTGKFVFKVKKTITWSLLDYSTLEKRKAYCEKENSLNQEICPELYEGVVPVFADGGKAFFEKPARGKIVDYAVKMKEMPRQSLLSERLRNGTAEEKSFVQLAGLLARFHARAATSPTIKEYGRPRKIREILNGTLAVASKLRKMDGQWLSQITRLTEGRESPFEKRVERVRECHGDCHAGNVFAHEGTVFLFDRLECDEWRLGDTARDVALTATDLDFNKHASHRKAFLKTYSEESSDETLETVLPFYCSYYAFVRGMVNDQKASGLADVDEANVARETADSYYELAADYF